MYSLAHLLASSHLPGPRGNPELLNAFAREADAERVAACLAVLRDDTANSPEEFLGMCGVLGYATLRRADIPGTLVALRPYAVHGSWRIREAVAMGLQTMGEAEPGRLLDALAPWVEGHALERRAVVAGLCEPRLLREPAFVARVLAVLGRLTEGLAGRERLTADETTLRQGLGYGWSVAVVAAPDEGKDALAGCLELPGRHPTWIVRENLRKNRLRRLDAAWVQALETRLSGA